MPNNFFQTQPQSENFGLGDYYRQVQANIAKGLLDPQSQFYQQFRSYLGSVTPSPGANSFLSLLQAGGGNMGASQVQAGQLQRGAEGRRQDFLNTATRGFASQNIGLGLGALGQAQQSDLQQRGIVAQKDIARMQEPGWLDFLGSIGGSIMGGQGFFAGLLPGGGGAGGASAAQASPSVFSDIRLKEDVTYIGGNTKDGIPIATFRFKGFPQKFRGVIAQDVEKIRPDLVTKINGFLAVKYGGL